jgi:hypothetical protein
MERGYLVALLSILAVFTGLSHGLRSFEQWSAKHLKHTETMATSQCHASTAAKAVAKLKTHLRPHYAEEAQLLAELNLPARVQSEIVIPSIGSASCARARAMQETERARRDMLRAQRDMMQMRIEPLSLQVNLPPDFERQIQQRTEAAMRLAEQQIKMQIVANQPGATARPRTAQ